MAKLDEKYIAVIAKTTLEYLDKEKEKREKKRHDRRLRNVKLLLKNYRVFAKHCEDIKLEINELDEKLELVDLDTDEFKLESIKRSKERTLAIVRFVNKMLKVYQLMCEQSNKPEEARRYETIHYLYISADKKTAEEISALQSVAVRTVFLDVEKACKDLSGLVFGVDGVRFFN